MEEKLANFFVKFADNAHLGKIATDLAPGIVLTITILLLLNSFTGLEIFPYTKLNQHQKRVRQARKEYSEADSLLQKLDDRVDSLNFATLYSSPLDSGKSKRHDAELEQLKRTRDRLESKRKDKKEQWDKLRVAEEEASSLKKNLEVFTDHFLILFIAGYLLGAILAQVSGKLFYNGYFHRHFKNRYP